MKKLVLVLLAAALGVGIGSYEAPDATAQDKGANKKTDRRAIDPDPEKCVKVTAMADRKPLADFGVLGRGDAPPLLGGQGLSRSDQDVRQGSGER